MLQGGYLRQGPAKHKELGGFAAGLPRPFSLNTTAVVPRVVGARRLLYSVPRDGHVAEWLRNGLQNRVPRFNSGRGLQPYFGRTGAIFVPCSQGHAHIGAAHAGMLGNGVRHLL